MDNIILRGLQPPKILNISLEVSIFNSSKLLGLLHVERNKLVVKAQSWCSSIWIAKHSSLDHSKPLHTITKQFKTILKRSVFSKQQFHQNFIYFSSNTYIPILFILHTFFLLLYNYQLITIFITLEKKGPSLLSSHMRTMLSGLTIHSVFPTGC